MGQFAQLQDAIDQYEGVIPSSRQAWVTNLIPRVEARLIGLVPSLATLSQASDPARFARVGYLVIEKVLEIYRNPTGAQSDSVMGQQTTWNAAISSGRIVFTDEELATVRQRTKRANLGTAMVRPWQPRGRRGVLRGPW